MLRPLIQSIKTLALGAVLATMLVVAAGMVLLVSVTYALWPPKLNIMHRAIGTALDRRGTDGD